MHCPLYLDESNAYMHMCMLMQASTYAYMHAPAHTHTHKLAHAHKHRNINSNGKLCGCVDSKTRPSVAPEHCTAQEGLSMVSQMTLYVHTK